MLCDGVYGGLAGKSPLFWGGGFAIGAEQGLRDVVWGFKLERFWLQRWGCIGSSYGGWVLAMFCY